MIRRGVLGRVGVVAVLVAGLAGGARGEPAPHKDVALLPLDAERGVELYGQPVASELARALAAGNVAVIVVGPRMEVPDTVRLIVDGTIALGKASTVTIALRLRNPVDGVVLETLSATAQGLAKIDGAAAELSSRILPLVRDRLAAIQHAGPPEDRGRTAPPRAAPEAERPLLVAVDAGRPGHAALAAAIDGELAGWARARHRTVERREPGPLDRKTMTRTVAASDTDLAVGFWILDYAPEAGAVPMARARVRVRIADAQRVRFDRVVATDTVVGERGLAPAELAARVAREVLAILRPHLRRSVPGWP
jgi:hypothetical protein